MNYSMMIKIRNIYNVVSIIILMLSIVLIILGIYSFNLGYFNITITLLFFIVLTLILYFQVLNRKELLLMKYERQ